jgi:DNA-binding beta-propeller fold protein YncE
VSGGLSRPGSLAAATSVTLALGLMVGMPRADAGFISTTVSGTAWSAANSFGLTQLSDPNDCISQAGGSCVKGTNITAVRGLGISPDGSHVYAGSFMDGSGNGSGVNAFARNAATGALTQLSGKLGCIADNGGTTCTDGHALLNVFGVAISPDGKQVYAAAGGSGAVAVLDRDTSTGALTQDTGTAGCVSTTGTGCVKWDALNYTTGVAVSPDGKHVYVTSNLGDLVAAFSRDATTGHLTQVGCVSETGTTGKCTDGVGLKYTTGVVVTPDGSFVYVSSGNRVIDPVVTGSSAVSVFSRDPTTGALTRLAGTAGCWSKDGTGGACTTFAPLNGASLAAVSPDGQNLYVPANSSSAVSVFHLDPATGALSQIADTRRCRSANGSGGVCGTGVGLTGAARVVVSPDGLDVYVGTDAFAIAAFSRA